MALIRVKIQIKGMFINHVNQINNKPICPLSISHYRIIDLFGYTLL